MHFLRKTFLWILLLPYAFFFLGTASNQLVILANHGTFPVETNSAWVSHNPPDSASGMLTHADPLTGERDLDSIHCVMTSQTHLNLLADVFDFHNGKESIGDLLLDAADLLKPYCWAMWMGLIVSARRPRLFYAGSNIRVMDDDDSH